MNERKSREIFSRKVQKKLVTRKQKEARKKTMSLMEVIVILKMKKVKNESGRGLTRVMMGVLQVRRIKRQRKAMMNNVLQVRRVKRRWEAIMSFALYRRRAKRLVKLVSKMAQARRK